MPSACRLEDRDSSWGKWGFVTKIKRGYMKMYIKVVSLMLFTVILLGFIGPFMVSDDSYEMPLLFVVIVVVAGAFVYRYVSKLLEKENEQVK
jgi:hypothetical protein